MHVFISWSLERSRIVAEAFKDWLPMVLQFVDTWMSSEDIEKGARWEGDIADRLDMADVGIVCLTPENLTRPWILFEAGALSKRVGRAHVCTVLTDLSRKNLSPPLSMFQDTETTKQDIKRLVLTINKIGDNRALPGQRVEMLFEDLWPRLEARITALPLASVEAPTAKPEDMIVEIRDILRSQRKMKDDQILAKLSCIELAMVYLSIQRQGMPVFVETAWKLVSKSHQFYGGSRDKLQEAVEPIWEHAADLVQRVITSLNQSRQTNKAAETTDPNSEA